MNKTSNVVDRAQQILVAIYRQLQLNGSMNEAQQKYFNGFVEAASLAGELSPEQLDQLIDNANLIVFGLTLAERKAQTAISDNPSLLDRPACERNRKSSDVLKEHLEKCS